MYILNVTLSLNFDAFKVYFEVLHNPNHTD